MCVGPGEEGMAVGTGVGEKVGAEDGANVGLEVGLKVGAEVGVSDGAIVGWTVGAEVGLNVGPAVGAMVGDRVGSGVKCGGAVNLNDGGCDNKGQRRQPFTTTEMQHGGLRTTGLQPGCSWMPQPVTGNVGMVTGHPQLEADGAQPDAAPHGVAPVGMMALHWGTGAFVIRSGCKAGVASGLVTRKPPTRFL